MIHLMKASWVYLLKGGGSESIVDYNASAEVVCSGSPQKAEIAA